MTDSNAFQLSQPSRLSDPPTEVLRSGAHALLAQAVAAEVAGFLEGHADMGGRRRRGLDRIAERPCAASIGSPAGKRRRIELQTRIRAEDDPAIARTRNRGANGCLAEFGVVLRNGNAAVGIVHRDHDVPAALGGGEFCLSVRRGPEPETALASMPARSSFPTGPISGSKRSSLRPPRG